MVTESQEMEGLRVKGVCLTALSLEMVAMAESKIGENKRAEEKKFNNPDVSVNCTETEIVSFTITIANLTDEQNTN